MKATSFISILNQLTGMGYETSNSLLIIMILNFEFRCYWAFRFLKQAQAVLSKLLIFAQFEGWDEEVLRNYVRQGKLLRMLGKWDEAIRSFCKALQITWMMDKADQEI